MAVERYVGNRWSGLSTDTLPTNVIIGSVFHETDTGTIYIYDGSSWTVGPQIGNLGDANISGLATGDFLSYNGTSWVNGPLVLADISDLGDLELNDLNDVTLSTPTQDQVMAYNGAGQWVNVDIGTIIAEINSLNDLSNVTISAPADDEILAYDNGTGEWINQTKAEAGFGDSATKNVTGLDTLVVSGTAGTGGNLIQWNADGDAVDAGVAASAVLTDITNENLGDLSDVVITTVGDDDLLAYDTASGDWINQTKTEAGFGDSATKNVTGLDALVVSGTAGTNGNLVEWNADGDAVDSGVATSSLFTSSSTLGDISDVTITTVGDLDILAYDSGTGDWINQTAAELGILTAVATDATITGDGNTGTPLSVNINDGGTGADELFSASHISSNYQNLSEKNVANGYVGLDSNAKINSTYLPALSITEVFVVADITARDALTIGTGDGEVQEGDVAVVLNASADSQVPSGSASYIWDGTSWQIMGTPDIEAAGADTQIQYNNAGDFGASTDFTFDDATSLMTLTGNFKLKENSVPTTPANDEAVYFVETDVSNTYVKVRLGNGEDAIVASYVQ